MEDKIKHQDVLVREARNEAKKESAFRDERESGVDVEYQKVRLERTLLISSWSPAKQSEKEAVYSLDELERLAQTAGAEVLGRLMQKNPLPDRTTYLGQGNVDELKALANELDADTVIANIDLLPSQRRALEDILQIKVIDRTELILDIFAQHATSKAGRVQIELAQLEYLLPRLRGWGAMMSRQAGGQVSGGAGMGSRGPGETQLEVDRRRINSKITLLKKKLVKIKREREVAGKVLRNSPTPCVAIVGYTNAGKSSLLNAIAGADILVQDALFATLDTTTRKIAKPRFNLTDTVGFIQDLPHSLVEAFRSTLESALDSDILLHVVDILAPDPKKQISAVNEALCQIRSVDEEGKLVLRNNENELLVFNKIDSAPRELIERFERLYPEAIFVSAKTKAGIDKLLEKLIDKISKLEGFKTVEELIEFSDGKRLSKLYQIGQVIERENRENGIFIKAIVPQSFK